MIRSLSRFATLTGLALALHATGCAPIEADDGEDSTSEEVAVGGAVYVRVRHDDRRCVSPLCGGYWVSRVNQRTLRCVDGTSAAECYVAEIDWSGLGLTDRALEGFQGRPFILRARIAPKVYGSFGTMGSLVAVEGWSAINGAEPTGRVHRVVDAHRVCVRAPCPSLDAFRLNSTVTATLTSVDLTRVAGVTRSGVSRGTAALDREPGLLVAGDVVTAASGARAVTASQFYLRVSAGVSDAQYCVADADCVMGTNTRDVASSADCYCRICPVAAMNVSTAERRDRAYQRHCASSRQICPLYRCMAPPAVACVNHACAPASLR
jgi:hypothetical protein